MRSSSLFILGSLLFLTCLIFFKIFIYGLYPVPGNLLSAFYFPFYSGGWEGYSPWTTYKEQFGADAIRQIYLWKNFTINNFKQGQIPLWNPYTFSGQPLLANFQSGVFYPLNIYYFFTTAINAWILLIISLPFLAGLFIYLTARSFDINKISSLFASISFMFSSYLITWMENGNVIHSYIWLPLVIWSVNEYFKKFRLRFIFILILAITMSILAGHPQTVIYLYMILIIFWSYKTVQSRENRFNLLVLLVIGAITPLLITALQLIPTIDFYRKSPISLPFNAEIFEKGILPYENLITFLAADFFGHPASKNFWSFSYGDFTPYIGVIPFVFAIWAIIYLWKKNTVKFAAFMVVLFILSAVRGPITWAIETFEIPLINASFPARFLSISIIFLVILAAFGFQSLTDNITNNQFKKKFLKFLLAIFLVYSAMWIFVFIGPYFLEPRDAWTTYLAVSKRNLIIPTLMFLTIPFGLLVFRYLNNKNFINKNFLRKLFVLGIFIVTIYGGMFYSNKYLPVSPKSYIFPEHPLFNWIQDNAGINRFYGGGTARVDFNMPMQYEVYVAEGYDTLRFKRYAQLLAAGRNEGIIPESYLRSDAAFPEENNQYRIRLFELLGVKYLLDKEDNPTATENWHYENYPGDDIFGVWQQGKFLVYERKSVLPRVFMSSNYTIVKDDTSIIAKIFNHDFNLKTIILEEEPELKIDSGNTDIIIPEIKKYESNEIIINTTNERNSLLFLSDAYSEDWAVQTDNIDSKLLRAHYAFRAVEVPKGNHVITFNYQPISFKIGLYISIISSFVLSISFLILFKLKKL